MLFEGQIETQAPQPEHNFLSRTNSMLVIFFIAKLVKTLYQTKQLA